jgi:tetratricopeptide (TPR) repeat protein
MYEQDTPHGSGGAQPYLPPVPPASVSTSQLPPDVECFVGRTSELAELRKLAARKSHTLDRARVIVISGKTGVGKSTLAIHFAHEIKRLYPYAQLYASLRANPSHTGSSYTPTDEERAADILEGFLRVLGVQGEAMPATLGEKEKLYRSRLVGKQALIVLDGAQGAEQVNLLIPAVATTLVVVTSQSSLRQVGASRLALDVLDLPSAVELLAVSAGGDKVDREPRAAEDVVSRCGRLPLAIVIAGARLATRAGWSLESLARRLSSGTSSVLEELREGETEIATSFSLSYQALTEQERTLFRRLAVFRGPHFDDAAAAALIDIPISNVATTLERLADLQLLEPAPWDDCYKFHDLLREFAKRHFEADESLTSKQQCANAVLDYYAARLRQTDGSLQPTTSTPESDGPGNSGNDERAILLRWLTRERGNLVEIVAQAIAAGRLDLAWKLAARLANFYEVRAHYDDWLDTHRSVLSQLSMPDYALGKAVLTRSLGKLFYFQHQWDMAVVYYREAMQLFQRQDLDREVGITLLYLGDAYRYQRDWDPARNTLKTGLDLLRATHFRRGEAIALRSLGAVCRLTGEFDEAIEFFGDALTIFAEIRDYRWIAATQLSLSDIYIDKNRPDLARPILEECLLTFQEFGDRHWEALTLRSLGDALRQLENFSEALGYLERSLSILRTDGDRQWEAAAIEGVGEVRAAEGKWPEAVAHYEECLAIFDDGIKDRLWEAHARKNLGIALCAQDDLAGAEDEWYKAWLAFTEQNAQEAMEVYRLLHGGALES